jgi:hypothetical protein
MSAPTKAEAEAMAQTWARLKDKPLEPILSFPLPLVPFNQLPGAGPGDYIAAALRLEIQEGRETVGHQWGWKPCMNCGNRRPETSENGGWCSACEQA